MPKRKLKGPTKKEQFVQVFDGKDIKGAAEKVGMCYAYARRLATKSNILEEVEKRLKDQAEKVNITEQRVLKEYELIGFSDLKNYLNPKSDLFIELDRLPEGYSRAIEAIHITRTTRGSGKSKMTTENIKFKLHAKQPALEIMARYQGMLAKDNKQRQPVTNNYWQAYIDLQKQAKQELIDDSGNRIKEHLREQNSPGDNQT